MFSTALAAALARRGIHYGWVMVALTFLIAVSSAGALGVLGAFMLPLQREFGWDISSISGALALRLLLFGLVAPFAAVLLQRYGLRRIIPAALKGILEARYAGSQPEPGLCQRVNALMQETMRARPSCNA